MSEQEDLRQVLIATLEVLPARFMAASGDTMPGTVVETQLLTVPSMMLMGSKSVHQLMEELVSTTLLREHLVIISVLLPFLPSRAQLNLRSQLIYQRMFSCQHRHCEVNFTSSVQTKTVLSQKPGTQTIGEALGLWDMD